MGKKISVSKKSYKMIVWLSAVSGRSKKDVVEFLIGFLVDTANNLDDSNNHAETEGTENDKEY